MSFQYSGEPLPSSINPSPDTFPAQLAEREFRAEGIYSLPLQSADKARRRIGRAVLDAFWLDMGACHNAASMQQMEGHPLHGWYTDHARRNRERIAAGLVGEERAA